MGSSRKDEPGKKYLPESPAPVRLSSGQGVEQRETLGEWKKEKLNTEQDAPHFLFGISGEATSRCSCATMGQPQQVDMSCGVP